MSTISILTPRCIRSIDVYLFAKISGTAFALKKIFQVAAQNLAEIEGSID
jgi:hypothetical protein